MKEIEKEKVANEIIKIRELLFEKLREVGFPIKPGQGDIKTWEDAKEVKETVEEILWRAVRQQYMVPERYKYPSPESRLNDLMGHIWKTRRYSLREAYSDALPILGALYPNIVTVDDGQASLTGSRGFVKEFPHRSFNLGCAEQSMMALAAGLAVSGKIPFISTTAILATKGWEQIRQTIAYSGFNVKIIATDAGVSAGLDGGSHQAIEDITLMRVLPNMTVIVPADGVEMVQVMYNIAQYKGPVYVRSSRIDFPVIYNEDYHFQIGKGSILREGEDITIMATGLMVHHALEAAKELTKVGIEARVINMSTIKPIDKELIIESAKTTGIILTAEEHLVSGGLGGAVCEVLAQSFPVPVKCIGIHDRFGISGEPRQLLRYFLLMPQYIVQAAEEILMKCKPKSVFKTA